MRPATIGKLAIVGVLALFFGGFLLRAAMRLVATAMHSLFFGILLIVVVIWLFAKKR